MNTTNISAAQSSLPATGEVLYATTGTVVAKTHETAGQQLLEPQFVIPGIVLATAALATAIGRIGQRWRAPRAETVYRETEGAGATKPTERTLSHTGTTLILENLLADVTITETGEELAITASGKQARMEQVHFKPSEGVLALTAAPANYRRRQHVTAVERWLWSSRMMRSITKRVVKGGGLEFIDESDVLQIVASVPTGTNLSIKRVDGIVNATGFFGDVDAEVVSRRELTLGRVGSATISSGSHSKVVIENADGAVSLHSGPFAIAEVLEGAASPLAITARHDSLACFMGSATNARLVSGTYATIVVGGVEGLFALQAGYHARTTIGQGNVTDALVQLHNDTYLEFGGHIDAGTIVVGKRSAVRALSYGTALQVQKPRSGRLLTMTSGD